MKALKIAVAVAALAAVTMVERPAPASCPAPMVSFNKARVRAGNNVTITGRYWFSGCQDVGICGGCGGCDYGPEEKPLRDISLFLKPKTRSPMRVKSIRLGEVDADEGAAFTSEVKVPRVQAGKYIVVAKTADGLSAGSDKTLRVQR